MIWKGGATECVRDDVCFEKENVVANDMQSATTWRGRRDLNFKRCEKCCKMQLMECSVFNAFVDYL